MNSIFEDYSPSSWIREGFFRTKRTAHSASPALGARKGGVYTLRRALTVALLCTAASTTEVRLPLSIGGANNLQVHLDSSFMGSAEPSSFGVPLLPLPDEDAVALVSGDYWDEVAAFMDEHLSALPPEVVGDEPEPFI